MCLLNCKKKLFQMFLIMRLIKLLNNTIYNLLKIIYSKNSCRGKMCVVRLQFSDICSSSEAITKERIGMYGCRFNFLSYVASGRLKKASVRVAVDRRICGTDQVMYFPRWFEARGESAA